MITKELLEYIKKEHLRGVTLDIIKKKLLDNGWANDDVEEAFKNLYPVEPNPPKEIIQPVNQAINPTINPVINPVTNQNTKEDLSHLNVMEAQQNVIGTNSSPVVNPTINPTVNPIVNPTINPVSSPTINPVINPIINPTVNTVIKPIANPSVSPTINPVLNSRVNTSLNPGATFVRQDAVFNQGMQPVKKKSSLVWIILLIIFILGGGAAAYGYYAGYFISFPTISAKAFDLASNANSVTYDSTLVVDLSKVGKNDILNALPGDLLSSKKIILTNKGGYDKTDPENFKLNNSLNLNLGMLNTVIEARILDKNFYVKVNKMPNIPFLGNLSSYENRWFSSSISSETIASGDFMSFTNFFGIDPQIFANLNQEQKDKFSQMTKSASFIKITQKYTPEVINGESSYHFAFSPDYEGIRIYLKNLKEYVNSVGKNDSRLSSFDPVLSYDEATTYIKSLNGEVWISRKDNLPRKLIINLTNFTDPIKTSEGEISLSFVTLFTDWNKPVEVKAPSDSMTFREMMEQTMGQARTKAIDAEIKASISSLVPSLALYQDAKKTYKDFCTTKTFKDISLRIKSSSVDATEVNCLDSKTKYIISAKLSDSTYFCIDSIGSSKVVPAKPRGLVCE